MFPDKMHRLLLLPAVLFACGQMMAQSNAMRCLPASERTGETGCWIVATVPWTAAKGAPVFWSLDTFPTQATAEAAKGPNGQVIRALGKVWVMTLSGKDDRPAGGTHVTQMGPLPLQAHASYTAQYMEAILAPGTDSVVHRHPGIEAFYTEAGESCLETPEGMQVGRPGTDVVVPEGPPMMLTASGTETRRSLVLVLHDSAHPWSAMAMDWKPKGLCHH